jgi:glycosyltransferase involved in cell wall biosynthesis
MLDLTAVLHTHNDALRLGRCLETLYPCDHILIIDHNSQDATVHIARQYGAQVIHPNFGTDADRYAQPATPGWVLALDPRESLTESLAASLFELKEEWKQARSTPLSISSYSVFLREETAEGWMEIPAPQTRLVPHAWNRWSATLPVNDPSAVPLKGELLHFAFP